MTFEEDVLKEKVGEICRHSKYQLKLKHYEKGTKFEKNLPPVLKKQLFLLSSIKTRDFFQILWPSQESNCKKIFFVSSNFSVIHCMGFTFHNALELTDERNNPH